MWKTLIRYFLLASTCCALLACQAHDNSEPRAQLNQGLANRLLPSPSTRNESLAERFGLSAATAKAIPNHPLGLKQLRLTLPGSSETPPRKVLIIGTYRGDVNGDGIVDMLDLEAYKAGAMRCPGAFASFDSIDALVAHIRSMEKVQNPETYANQGGLAGCSLNDQDLLQFYFSQPA